MTGRTAAERIIDSLRRHPTAWVFVLLLLLLALVSALAQQTVMRIACVDSETEKEQIRTILYHGIDKGMEEYIKHIFSIMAKDPAGQPQRAARGMEPAYLAYVHSRRAISAWSPPLCGQEKK